MKQYAWEDYKVLMGGRFVTGVRGFTYGTERDKQPIYGEGSQVQSYGRGNVTHHCEMKCLQSELEAIILSGGGDPTDIPPFTVVHSYTPKRGLPIVVDVIKDVEITSFEKSMDQGANYMEVTLQCVCVKIDYNVTKIPNQ
ncbi:MAG: hypothetical protein FWC10_01915 [Lentimicrobiaceae bacterium]|nr:hypothetical protein [Lentimicrobiaceae bacterium]